MSPVGAGQTAPYTARTYPRTRQADGYRPLSQLLVIVLCVTTTSNCLLTFSTYARANALLLPLYKTLSVKSRLFVYPLDEQFGLLCAPRLQCLNG
jgi:hypothetical protein